MMANTHCVAGNYMQASFGHISVERGHERILHKTFRRQQEAGKRVKNDREREEQMDG